MKKTTLFCFPYAGGSAAVYNQWRPYLGRHIDLRPVELAGRGRRIRDPFYGSLEAALEDVLGIVGPQLDLGPYAFFGHSMGAVLAYELARRIRQEKRNEPLHLFFSGRGAPHVPYEDETIFYTLPEEEFRKEVVELGGTPAEVFEHPELLEVILPILRNDFKITETYEHKGEVESFDCPVTVFIGKQEDVTAEQMFAWKEYTRDLCSIHYFEGGHFFIHDHTEAITGLIVHALEVSSRGPGHARG